MLPITDIDINIFTESDAFRTFSNIMVNLTGLAISLYTPDGSHIRQYAVTINKNPLCTLIRANSAGLTCCHDSEKKRFSEVAVSRQAICNNCHAGFVEIAIPVTHQGKVIVIISSGQILPIPSCEEGFQQFMPLCEKFKISPKDLRDAYYKCVYLNEDKINAAMQLMTFFAEYLCTMTQKIIDAETEDSTAIIIAAKKYINDQIAKELSLPNVANHINRSPGYLSRNFERTVGETFTAYVQQVRIEKVQHKLLHSSLSITEIALECGFNSISQFNRTFRKYNDCTPRTFRSRYQN
jgi:AraC-like DNA-binding protein/ligand-binding sensor protein